jgi:sugar fermentation stimulation protein A
MLMQFSELIPAFFAKKGNRFTAGVRLEAGGVSTAFIPTTGRLTGVLTPGCKVWLEKAENPDRKTPYTLVLSELSGGGLCSTNAYLANGLFSEAVEKGGLAAFPYKTVENEVPIGHSRLDFRLSNEGETCWVEVKSVTYVENDVGLFPDAPTSRGRKHLGELEKLAENGDRACAVFVAQRGDALTFAPYEAIDPEFAEALRHAVENGVEVHAYRCAVSTERIEVAEEITIHL